MEEVKQDWVQSHIPGTGGACLSHLGWSSRVCSFEKNDLEAKYKEKEGSKIRNEDDRLIKEK